MGGTSADLLVGNAGNDLLQGGKGKICTGRGLSLSRVSATQTLRDLLDLQTTYFVLLCLQPPHQGKGQYKRAETACYTEQRDGVSNSRDSMSGTGPKTNQEVSMIRQE